jgi:hypothetical protein
MQAKAHRPVSAHPAGARRASPQVGNRLLAQLTQLLAMIETQVAPCRVFPLGSGAARPNACFARKRSQRAFACESRDAHHDERCVA